MGIGALMLIALTIAPMTDLDGFSFGKSSLQGSPYEGFEGLQNEFEKRTENMATGGGAATTETKNKNSSTSSTSSTATPKKEGMSNNSGEDDGEDDNDEDSDKKKKSKSGDEEENFDLLSPGSFSAYGNKTLDNGLSLVGFTGVYYPSGQEQKLSVGFEGETECAKKFGLNGGARGVQMTAEQCKLMMSRGGNV